VSPDLRSATAFVVPLAGANQETVIAALRRAVPYLRGQLAHEVDLRYVPQLRSSPTPRSITPAASIRFCAARTSPAISIPATRMLRTTTAMGSAVEADRRGRPRLAGARQAGG